MRGMGDTTAYLRRGIREIISGDYMSGAVLLHVFDVRVSL